MKILTHKTFDKHFRKRILSNPKLVTRFEERVAIFTEDPQNPLLKDHPLTGSQTGHRAFWITGDIRVVYEPVDEDTVNFLDIGTHNQVY